MASIVELEPERHTMKPLIAIVFAKGSTAGSANVAGNCWEVGSVFSVALIVWHVS